LFFNGWTIPKRVYPLEELTRPGFNERELIYVVTEKGTLMVGEEDISIGSGGHHHDLARGRPVLAAGQASIHAGRWLALNNASGHYKPFGPSAKAAAIGAFMKAGFRAENIEYTEHAA
jgi:hypothetical protein